MGTVLLMGKVDARLLWMYCKKEYNNCNELRTGITRKRRYNVCYN